VGENLSVSAELKRFDSALGHHLFVVDGSRIFDIDEALAVALDKALRTGSAEDAWSLLGIDPGRGRWVEPDQPIPPPPVSAISLNIAQVCNMACGYCYADEGRFGARPRLMSLEVARQSVDRLIKDAAPEAPLLLGFMGGEPLLNRDLLHAIVPYAIRQGAITGHRFRFSLTTNATLLTAADAVLFKEFPFSVQISIDGPPELNDLQRPLRNGEGTYSRVLQGLELLRLHGRPRELGARVTITRKSRDLLRILDHLIGLGFDDVGFALAFVSPDPELAIQEQDFRYLLRELILCADRCREELLRGRPYPFDNFLTALDEIHRGTHRPYPCGAGAAYLSANAEGRLYACHRLIDEQAFAMGDVRHGPDHDIRRRHLERHHVDRIDPCRSCWGRYLCGGGCYHEVAKRGRPGCDFIRGWLEYCLTAYAELSAVSPEGFKPRSGAQTATGDPAIFAS
jgi:uncharacterized protein